LYSKRVSHLPRGKKGDRGGKQKTLASLFFSNPSLAQGRFPRQFIGQSRCFEKTTMRVFLHFLF
jgi:hypothetical protein